MPTHDIGFDKEVSGEATFVTVHRCGRELCTPGYTFGPAMRAHYIIHYIINGKGCFIKNDGSTRYELSAGQGFLICPGETTVYSADEEEPWEYCWIGFTGVEAERLLCKAGLSAEKPIFRCADGRPERCVQEIIDEWRLSSSSELARVGSLMKLLAMISNDTDVIAPQNRAEYYVSTALSYIHENYSYDISVKMIADYIGIDRSYLFKLFRARTGMSVQSYVENYRLTMAARLMLSSGESIGEICCSCGFSSTSYFSRAFKEKFGVTPRKYMQDRAKNGDGDEPAEKEGEAMRLTRTKGELGGEVEYEELRLSGENGELISKTSVSTLNTRYEAHYVKTLNVGGVFTPPEHRRLGYVRRTMERILEDACARGYTVSLLHPFDCNCYRKFGYELLSDHVMLDFPMSFLSGIEPCRSLRRMDAGSLGDALAVYERFSCGRSLMLERSGGYRYSDADFRFDFAGFTGVETYIYYENGAPEGYIIYSGESRFEVNRSVKPYLHVHELAYTSPDALRALLGFVTLFAGEYERVRLENIAMSPEVRLLIPQQTGMEVCVVPDIMGRVLDVKRVLELHEYPVEPGRFRIRLDDGLGVAAGVWSVEFENGRGEAKKLPDAAEYDAELTMPAFTRLAYGCSDGTEEGGRYIPGVRIKERSDLFRAFPHRVRGAFEHF